MLDDIPEVAESLPGQLWRSIVPHLGTMNRHVYIALHNEFVMMVHEKARAVTLIEQTGPHQFSVNVKPHVIEAFRRLAHELRHTRSFVGIGERPVEHRRVPRGIVAGHAKAKRESIR